MKKLIILFFLGILVSVFYIEISAATGQERQFLRNFIDGVNEYQSLRRQYFANLGPSKTYLLFKKLDILYKKISRNSVDQLRLEFNPNYRLRSDHLGKNLAFLATSIFEFKDGLMNTGEYRNHQLAQSKIHLDQVLPLYNYLVKTES